MVKLCSFAFTVLLFYTVRLFGGSELLFSKIIIEKYLFQGYSFDLESFR